MKKQDDYTAGSHDYWVHFWCGVVFGALYGASLGWRAFSNGWLIACSVIVTSLVFGVCCGRWGDPVWLWLISNLDWFS